MSEVYHAVRDHWEQAAATYDEDADHGLGDPATRAAWADRLHGWLPDSYAEVADLGCGTGSLAALLVQAGHRVTAVDAAPAMVRAAEAKLAALGRPGSVSVLVGDAADPPLAGGSVDAVLARHVLWTLADPQAALRRWVSLVRPGGRLVLVEGRWSAPSGDRVPDQPAYAGGASLPWLGGVEAATLTAALEPLVRVVRHEPLADPVLWGREIDDERYALVADV